MDYSIIETQNIYSGKVLDLRKDIILLPGGKKTVRELVEHKGAAAIVAVKDSGRLILVNQHRHAAGDFVLEIPAGKLEAGENPLVCAARELTEETGYSAQSINYMFKAYAAIGYSNEIIYYYLATNLTKGQQSPDEDEFIDLVTVNLEEALQMIQDGKIVDSKTISAILYYKEFMS